MKTDISTFKAKEFLATVRALCPSVCIEAIWSADANAKWDIEDDSLDRDDFTAWQSEVRASAIIAGQMLSGSAYLGGTWEKFGDNPNESNPEISGYLPQMLEEALRELGRQTTDLQICNQVIAALKAI